MKTMCLLLNILLFAFAVGAAAAQSSQPVEMTINDSKYGPASGLNSDGNGPYIDNSDSGGNPCVTAQVSSSGIFYAKIDFNPATYPLDCDTKYDPPPIPVRAYILTIGDLTACQAVLGLTASLPCSVTVEGNFVDKIFAGSLFAAKSASTSVLCDFVHNGNVYRVKADSANVSGAGSTRTADFFGFATLYKQASNGKLQQVGSPFLFRFNFTVTVS